jgi:hypothetical protein
MLNNEYQQLAADAICHAARMAGETWQQASYEFTRPSVLFRPALSIDRDEWCALYGNNLQDGVAGFGKSPDAAMRAFDTAWQKSIS